MNLSIIIPTYNRLARLRQVLAALARQSYPPEQFEVIVVSDGSSDGTDAYLQSGATPLPVEAILQENQGVAAARNAGIAAARHKLLLFLDDDVVPAPALVEEHVFKQQELGPGAVVMGPMLTPPDKRLSAWVQWEQMMLGKQYAAMARGDWAATARQFYTGNTSLRRAEVVAAGGFDPAFRRAEDVELAYRLADRGATFHFHAAAAGHHYAERSYASWRATPTSYGRSDVIFTRAKGQTWLLPTIYYEYQGRSPLVRGLVQLCLDRTQWSRFAEAGLHAVGRMAYALRNQSVPRMVYSGIFNLRHYQGIADELGGREVFFDGVSRQTEPPVVPGQHALAPASRDREREEAADAPAAV
jgi:glycosyltransferase involved in cell wall biosynthesis